MKYLLAALLVLVPVLTAAADPPSPAPRIEIEPADNVVLGEPVTVRVRGLEPGARAVLKARILDRRGAVWESAAAFRAASDGTVDLGRDAPVAGSYRGVDRLGLFWSMRELRGLTLSEGQRVAEKATSTVLFELQVGDRVVAEKIHRRWLRRPEVVDSPVRDNGLVGTFFHPDGKSARPGVILVGGAAGGNGWQEGMGEWLASRGFAAFALAYFGMEALPPSLEKIPLEYFDRAVAWMVGQSLVGKKRLAIMGTSKGGELALVAASGNPSIGAVVAWVPSSFVFQSLAPGYPRTSSWTFEERELAFVPFMMTENYNRSGRLADLYRDSLLNRIAAEPARILVERIQGPVLLLSGRDDTLWPSSEMAGEIMARLSKHKHPFEARHFAYKDAGHHIALYPAFPSDNAARRGGTERGNAHATADAWARAIAFLRKHL